MARQDDQLKRKAGEITQFLYRAGTGLEKPTPAQVTAGITWLKKHGFYTDKTDINLKVLPSADRIAQARQKAIRRVDQFHAGLGEQVHTEPVPSLEYKRELVEKYVAGAFEESSDGDNGSQA